MVPWMSGLVNGLQNRLRRFESARHLTKYGKQRAKLLSQNDDLPERAARLCRLPKQEGLARRPQGTKGRWREAEKQSQPFGAICQRSASRRVTLSKKELAA